jgi:pimeloyl-ACP methyl ester carboxylesterase
MPGRAGTEVLALPDGRALAFRLFGDPGGQPVFVFHGATVSGLLGLGNQADAERAGVLQVTVDRPGFGGSDLQPDRRLLDWPADVTALANHLGMKRFAVAGVSAGGPYAMACAYRIPERLKLAAMIAGVGPPQLYEHDEMVEAVLRSAALALDLARARCDAMAADIEASIDRMIERAASPDQEIYRRPEVRTALIAARQDAFRFGIEGAAVDMVQINSAWGFDPQRIDVPVRLWHGANDLLTHPPFWGRSQPEFLGAPPPSTRERRMRSVSRMRRRC